jgi:hypothetical protein
MEVTSLRIEGKSDAGRAPFTFACSILSVGYVCIYVCVVCRLEDKRTLLEMRVVSLARADGIPRSL